MIEDASGFVFKAPASLYNVRRILIKPSAGYPVPYPVTTSRQMISNLINGIRQVTDADIIILEGNADGTPVRPIYKELGYDFPRVLTLDIKDSIWVEVDNPLNKPYAVPTFWVPNIILSSDYLITVAPLKVVNGVANFTLMNLLSLLPYGKVGPQENPPDIFKLGVDKVLADLYFTISFDLGIIEADKKFTSIGDPTKGKEEEYGKVFSGEPYEVDREAAETLGVKAEYLELIKEAKVGFEV